MKDNKKNGAYPSPVYLVKKPAFSISGENLIFLIFLKNINTLEIHHYCKDSDD